MKHVQVRVSDGEYDALLAAAGDIPIQRFVRSILIAGIGASGTSAFDSLKESDRDLVLRYAEHLKNGTDPVFLGIIRTMLDRMESGKP